MVSQIQAVASGEEQHLAAVDAHSRRLSTTEHAHAAVGTALADPAESLCGSAIQIHFRIAPSAPESRKEFVEASARLLYQALPSISKPASSIIR